MILSLYVPSEGSAPCIRIVCTKYIYTAHMYIHSTYSPYILMCVFRRQCNVFLSVFRLMFGLSMSHHHTYHVTSSYILCHIIIIHTMSHHHTYVFRLMFGLCHIIIHPMSQHHTSYVTASYILCHSIIHPMSHHHTYICLDCASMMFR